MAIVSDSHKIPKHKKEKVEAHHCGGQQGSIKPKAFAPAALLRRGAVAACISTPGRHRLAHDLHLRLAAIEAAVCIDHMGLLRICVLTASWQLIALIVVVISCR